MRRLALLAVLLSGAMSLCQAQAPDLNGTWKLNVARSFLAGDHASPDYVLLVTLRLQGSSLSITTDGTNPGEGVFGLPASKSAMELPIDGKPHDVTHPGFLPGMPPSHVAVSAEWQGSTLSISERGASFGGVSSTRRRYFLSEDKTQLIELIESHSTFGDAEQRMVFEKQP